MKNTKGSIPLLLISIFAIICSAWNVIWLIMELIVVVSGKAQQLVTSNYDWSGLFNKGGVNGTMCILNAFLVGSTAFFQMLSCIVGLIYSGMRLGGKNIKFSAVPIIFGAVITLSGLLASVTLIFSGYSDSVTMQIVMWCSLFAESLLYLICAAVFVATAPAENLNAQKSAKI